MKTNITAFSLFLLFAFAASSSSLFAQSEPVMYFCESYGDNGEVGVADRFTTGYLTIMVKCDYSLNLAECSIQFDKWDGYTGQFKFNKKFDYTLERDMKYVFFTRNEESDLSFDEPGFYRVFLLDSRDRTVASALIQIIEK